MCVLWIDMVGGRVFIHYRWVWVENDDNNAKGCWNNALLSLLCFVSKMQSQGGGGNGGCPIGVSWDLGFFGVLYEFVWVYVYIPRYVVFCSDVNEV